MRTKTRKKAKKRAQQLFDFAKGRPDYLILALTGIFLVLGLIMIFDASIFNADEFLGDRFYFVKKQVMWIVVGAVFAAVFYFWDYHKYKYLAVPGMVITILALIAVLVFGENINGSTRWFKIAGVTVQPSELAKPVFVLYLSSWLSKDRKGFKTLKEAVRFHFIFELGAFLLLLGIVGGLIIAERDLGTTIVIFAISFVVYFTSGSDIVHVLGSILIVFLGSVLGLLAAIVEPYRFNRVKTFLDLLISGEVTDPRGTGYQMQQILIGIGSGGFWGKGFGQSRQRFGYLVEITAFTDSIFAIILEEVGMLGGIILIMLFLLFVARVYKIASRAPDKLGKLLAGGIGFWLVFQAFMHMGANVGIVPLTGVPLTFFTYGGSSIVVALAGVGMLLNVSRYSEK